MADLVERLLDHDSTEWGALMMEAADEIKRLREMNDNQYQRLHDQIELNAKLEKVLEHAKHLLAGGGDEAVHHLENSIAAAEDEK